MGNRGRQSAAELSIQPVALSDRRPEPPASMSEAAAQVWRDTVGTLPPNWLSPGQHPLLIAYCRHAAQADDLAKHVASFEADWLQADGGIERLNKLLAMGERETRAMTACARSMRITKQSQVEPRGAARALGADANGMRPWEVDDEDPNDGWAAKDKGQ